MSYLTLDEKMAARFSGINETTELRTEEGKVLGTYVPAVSPEQSVCQVEVNSPFDLDLAERDLQAGLKGRSLEEIWKSLRASGKTE
jgi:hypothetical protein